MIYRQGDLKAAHMFIVLHGSVQSQVISHHPPPYTRRHCTQCSIHSVEFYFTDVSFER
eukprot:COSAG05_NODE_107_length_18696_cov_209.227766_10_plen_58_part_00